MARFLAQAATVLLSLAAPVHAADWPRFEIIQWQARTPAQLETLKRIGVTAGKVTANREGNGTPVQEQFAPLHAAGMRWFVENIATDYYASYHRWTPGKIEHWRFLDAQQRYSANPNDPSVMLRDPSFLDPVWQTRITNRLTATVREESRYRPLYYALGDETGIADLSAAWDFDMSPRSIAGFRVWLRGQYSSLAALNAEWGTHYTAWDAVQPETTNQAMARSDDNFAAWSDFKAWMDVSFARALRMGTDTIHRADPRALSAIEGAQIPGWGGYDYTRLAHTVDVMEVNDDGENMPILRSINSDLITLGTSFLATPPALHQIWRSTLRGTRGLILWDEDNSIAAPDGTLKPRGEAYAPLFKTLRGDVVRRIIGARQITDPVAILYSPVSFRVRWMLDHRPEGDAWTRRSAEKELEDNQFRIAMRGFKASLGTLGLTPRFITPDQLAAGQLTERVLILPDVLALSAAEARAAMALTRRGGMVIAGMAIDGMGPGTFDGHGKRLPRAGLASDRMTFAAPTGTAAIGALLIQAGVKAAFALDPPRDDVETYVYRAGADRIVALHRRMAGDTPLSVTLTLPGGAVRDLLSGHDLGRPRRLTLTLDAVTPVVLEVSP